ncbi:MAG TPA: FliM/FliN family flagellar motor switch protein [Steroidobacteraceae bacterium]|nr:FliM/FliN family flagellar motor switch protein [Steroidobacteraceae bacterium]
MSSNVVSRVDLPLLNNLPGEKGRALGERMELVEQVPVRLTVTLGETEMNIGKLFALAPNDVVALDRDADAPVDVRLNGRIVARGALVAVGDKFGVRITEIQPEAS